MKFIKNICFGIGLLIISSILYGCSNMPIINRKVENVIPVPEVQSVEVTLIEGKTTKQEIIDALGMPRSLSDTSLSYEFRDDIQAKLHVMFEDGTKFNVILGDGQKYDNLSISFDGEYDENGNYTPSNKNTDIHIY